MGKKAKRILLHFSIGLALAVLVFCLVFFLGRKYSLAGWCDALFVSGSSVLGAGLLLWCHRSGSFDVLRYGVVRLIDQFRHRDDPPYKNAGDYQEAMKEKRHSNPVPYWTYLCLAAALLFAALICLIVWNSSLR